MEVDWVPLLMACNKNNPVELHHTSAVLLAAAAGLNHVNKNHISFSQVMMISLR